MSGLGLGGYYGYQWWQNQELQKTRPTVVKAKDGTNINAAWHKLPAYQKELRQRYSFINKTANYVPPRTWDGKDAVIQVSFQLKAIILKLKSGILPIA